MLWLILAMLGLAAVVALSMGDAGTLGGMDGGTLAALISSIALLIFIGGPFLAGQRGRLSKSLKDLLIWVGVLLLLVLGYSFRDDAKLIYQRIAGELMPPGHTLSISDGRADGQQAVRIRRQPNGHFTARSIVNGLTIMMLVDTGASSIVLKASDARRVGINVDQLKFRVPVRTANGVAYAASTRIGSIAVGSITMYNLNVMVAKPGALSESLLGMNFLTRLRSYEFSGDFLTLRG
ncbi:MAG: retropepsin-like aspartic protease family protein [Hyphomicrobiaceae bacterium]